MLLVIDVGNTNIVVGIYKGDELINHWRLLTSNYRTGDEFHLLLNMLFFTAGIKPSMIRGCCISSVVPDVNPSLIQLSTRAFGFKPIMVEPGIKTGIILQVENPKEVGADRIVNAVAGIEEYGRPLIIVDFGTATTFDVVTDKAEWIGGIIVPGIQLSAEALFEHCAKLPHVDIVIPNTVIGKNTVDNIRIGLTYGYADLVDGLITRIQEEMGIKMKVVATGGMANLISKITKNIDVVDPLLTLKGLKLIYDKNIRGQK
ncbi:MAG: type III pantothenate kinase [Candidatus Hydrogenedentes bacterium]|nr:type III pantothenate kinase [Candidatus Hydrogenedentota bacterium]